MPPASPLPILPRWSIENDSRFVASKLPLFQGAGAESRACGGCGKVIVQNVTIEALYANLRGYKRVVVTCLCGAHNLLVEERRQHPR